MFYRRFIVLAALTVLISASLFSCKGKVSDEDMIKAAVKQMADGADAKEISKVKKHISKGYKDPAGNDYDALRGIIAYYFVQPESINVFLRKTDVEIKSGKGYATVRAVISRGRKVESVADIVPAEAGGFIFDLTFGKEDGDWLLTSAVWRQVGISEAL